MTTSVLLPQRYAKLLFLLALIIFISYSNTFDASWHLDDEPNILTNSKLHVSKLTLQQIKGTLRAHPSRGNQDKFYRPLPCLTFGFNWYIGQDNVFGYHIVNLIIHILTAWFLFLTLHLLLHVHYKKQYPPQFFIAAALLAALLWALAPIQTQAVTYIVQRMASMAAMFCIISIYTYLRGRIASEKKNIWYFFCVLAFFAALGSKENAILLLPSLVLLEFSFFKHGAITRRHVVIFAVTASVLLVAAAFFIHYMLGHLPFNFLDGYKSRSFTFSERILTQPRIVLMYLSQIVFPNVQRLSIEHDIVLSTSLFSPWTTLPAILTIFLFVSSSLFFLKKHPLFCFPVLFFFLNHTVESTIVPLELIFEHRNYLPSFFLFLPIGILVAHILYSTPPQPIFRRATAILCTSLFLIISGHATYTRNQAWATVESLWSDAMRKAPDSSRSAHYLGKWYRQLGHYKQAFYYFQLALKNAEKAAAPKMTKTASLNGSATVAYLLGKHKQALQYYNQCVEIDKKNESCLNNRALAYLQLGQPKKSLPDAIKLTEDYPDSLDYQYLAASSAYLAEDYEVAMKAVQKIAARSLSSHENMYLTGILLMKNGAYPNSLFFLKQADKMSPNTAAYQLALVAAYHANEQTTLAKETIQKMRSQHSLARIIKVLNNAKQQNTLDNNAVEFVEHTLTLSPNRLLF
ncbi:MAG: hypothetical protein D3914_02150 [Candidatus Electrothrix sp. LOE2]|nr:hypothetical protein [Candidatus Electrothrix sp. LOE2]